MLTGSDSALFDPLMMPRYLKLNEAIEHFTRDIVRHDAKAFRQDGCDIRYVVERQLFFATFSDRAVHDYFVACETQQPLPNDNDLSFWLRQIAPYFRGEAPVRDEPLSLRSRALRYLYRSKGRPTIRTVDCSTSPLVLFLVIHPKFVRYLKPVADRLKQPYAFLTIDDPEMFDYLSEQQLPRIEITLDEQSRELVVPEVQLMRQQFRPGHFDSWFVSLNAVRRALLKLRPTSIVVPEGNAAIYELANQAARTAGVPTVCVQQGWAPVVHPGFRNMTYSKMLVWGQAFIEMLRPYNPDQHFVATGNHIVGSLAQGDVRNRRSVAFFLQNGAHWLTDAATQAMFDLVVWAAEQFPDCEVRLREHPGQELEGPVLERLRHHANVHIMSPAAFTLQDTFAGCRVAVAINSTTILEAVASGVVPLILDVSGWGAYQPDVASEGGGVEVQSFADARIQLQRLMQDDDACAAFAPSLDAVRHRLFARNDEKALDAIVAEISRPDRERAGV